MIKEIIKRARHEGRGLLFEHEIYGILDSLGLPVPRHRFIPIEQIRAEDADYGDFSSHTGKAVIKVVAERILHKSDVGGVVFIDTTNAETVDAAISRMLAGLPADLAEGVSGVLLAEAVSFEQRLGAELLLGMRHSADFGAIFTLGFGGTYTEALGAATRPNQGNILFKPHLTSAQRLESRLESTLFFRFATGGVRGVDPLCDPAALRRCLDRWIDGFERLYEAVDAAGARVEELEVNPLVWDGDRLVAVDALLRLASGSERVRGPQAVNRDFLRRGLHPERVALIGVSRKMNVGRIILRAMIEGGYPKEKIVIIRKDADEIDGVGCVPELSDVPGPEPVDMLIVAVAAEQVPEVLRDVVATGRVCSVLLVPGGMGETEGGKEVEQQVVSLLAGQPPEKRPVLIGNNTLGIVSRPARFDTLFIPREKLPRHLTGPSNIALVSQSGAFMLSTLNKLDFLNPDYQLSIGNQIDAHLSDYLETLAEIDRITTFALYIEGFRPGDGERTAAAVQRLAAAGKDVIVYKAGRTDLGQHATMGHTASIAGDYRVFQELMHDAGALVASTVPDFVDFVRLSSTLAGRPFGGNHVALMSNAGYEVVGMADNHRGVGYELEPAVLTTETRARLQDILCEAGLDRLVNVDNPLDVTPMADDRANDLCMRALLEDPGVDVAVFGCVPFTSRLNSLPPGILAGDSTDAPDGYAARTARIFATHNKPVVLVVDAGELYDRLADTLQTAGIPVFRSAGRAIRLFGRYVTRRLDV